jgi:hypothetical protein
MSGPPSAEGPTAVQALVDEHDTLIRLVAPVRAGLSGLLIDHRFPFHRSANGYASWPPYGSFVQMPTAMHMSLVGHDTLHRRLNIAPGGLGDGSTDHPAAWAIGAPCATAITTTHASDPQRSPITAVSVSDARNQFLD